VKSERGWHVVRVLERRAAAVRPYDETTAREAQQRVLSRRRNDLQNELFKELAERYRVTWHQGEQAAAGGVAPPANSQTAPAAPAPVPASAPAPTKQD
jgi:parvulin-like peptidyl-prolyl isomerase